MKRKINNLITFCFVLTITNNCIDPILFPINTTTASNLVIYGQLTDIDEPHYVYIQRSSVDDKAPTPVRGAAVTLVDEEGTRYPFKEDKPGRYKLLDLTQGIAGKAYGIKVVIGSNTYSSSLEKIPMLLGTDSLHYSITEESYESGDNSRIVHHLQVFAKSQLPIGQPYYLRWDTDEVYYMELTNFPDPFNTPAPDCFASGRVDPQRITLLDGTTINGLEIQQLVAVREIDFTFTNRHYIIVRQLSTTLESYEYWNKVKLLLGNTGSPFDIPPAIIQGNISNLTTPDETVLGYFETCRVSTNRFFLVPGYIPYYIEPLCTYDPAKPINKYSAVCLNCNNLPNGTSERPPWF
ncbi:MAG: DUF4249 domain-containing protein [Cyclobacteriaceae bacterium]|nr:DUF4249 domain-containing protein [Cyclobacteriaceae bacterium]